jgi:SAM-dependent methyltransferase
MNRMQEYWNRSTERLPIGKDASAYAIEKEKLFPRHSTVLDLGGGMGVDSLLFARAGHEVDLLDVSDTALDRAEQLAIEQGLEGFITTHQADLSHGELPLETAAYDIAYSRLALHYFDPETTAQLFSEIYRVLRPEGKAFLTLKSPDDAAEMEYLRSTADQKDDGVFSENGFLKTRYSIDQLAALLKRAGINARDFRVDNYMESLDGRNDTVKSGNTSFHLNEVRITKPTSEQLLARSADRLYKS